MMSHVKTTFEEQRTVETVETVETARSVRNVKQFLEAKIIRPLESAKCIQMILGMYLRNPKNGVQMYLKMYMLLPQRVVQISSTSPKRVCGGSHQLTSSKHPQLGINFMHNLQQLNEAKFDA